MIACIKNLYLCSCKLAVNNIVFPRIFRSSVNVFDVFMTDNLILNLQRCVLYNVFCTRHNIYMLLHIRLNSIENDLDSYYIYHQLS